jgi:hypothetical protein
VVLPASCDVYVERIAALFVASDSSSHVPIVAVAAKSVPGIFSAVFPNAVIPDAGSVCRFVVVPVPFTEVSSACVISPVGSADSDTFAPRSAFVAFVFFQKNFA